MEVCSSPVRGAGCVEAGREGLRPGRGRRSRRCGVDGDHPGCGHPPGAGAARAPDRRAGHVGGDGSDGGYWKPFCYLLEDGPFEVMLVNAGHVKNLPGRKSGVSDAAWPAQLGAHGLVRASFVPPEPIRRLRDLTRTRTTVVRERAREIQRLEKLLADALLTELRGGFAVSCG